MADLRVRGFGLEFANPVVVSSGPTGFGPILAETVDMRRIGAFTCKTVTRKKRVGNPPPRLVDCGYGIIASIGLQNPGIEEFVRETLPSADAFGTRLIVSIAGFCLEDFAQMASLLETVHGFDILELNLSCPNVESGLMNPSEDPRCAGSIVAEVKKHFASRPVTVKLSPESLPQDTFIRSCESSGADGFTLFNAYHGARFDINTGRPFLRRTEGAYSSPALKPIVLKKIRDARYVTDRPIIATGGASTAEDILEFILAGASLVGFGLVGMIDPEALEELPLHLERCLEARGFVSLDEYCRYLRRTAEHGR